MAVVKKLLEFIEKTNEFPCSFNLETADLGSRFNNSCELQKPNTGEGLWSYFKRHLEENTDQLDPELVDPTWKDNLRVRVYAELGDFDKAEELNKEILERSPENLVALTNFAYLLASMFQFDEAENVVAKLEEIKQSKDFNQFKLEAICEQGYTYTKIAVTTDKTNKQNAIKILEYCVNELKTNEENYKSFNGTEKLELMLAILYRRSSFPMRDETDYEFTIKAVKLFSSILESTLSNSVKSICFVELARINKNEHGEKFYVSDYSVTDLCQLAVELKPHSLHILETLGPILVSVEDLSKAESLLQEIIKKTNESLAHSYLGGVYFSQAKRFKSNFPKAHHTINRRNTRNDVVKLLLSSILKMPAYSAKNTYLREAIKNYTIFLKSDYVFAGSHCIIAFKMFQAKEYDEAWNICQKIIHVGTILSACHIDAYYIMALCCAIRFANSSVMDNYKEIENKCLEMAVLSIRCAAVLLFDEEEAYTEDQQLLWQGFLVEPENMLYYIMDPKINCFDRLQKLMCMFKCALPDLERIIQKTDEDWNDVTQIEQELEQLKNTNLNLALLYLSLINLRPETRQRISWRNSHVVQAIKLEAAKDIFTQGKQADIHTRLWQEIFKEEFQIDPHSKKYPAAHLDRLIQGTACDIFIVENIKPTDNVENDNSFSEILEEVLNSNCDLLVLKSTDFSNPFQINYYISRSTVLIFIQKKMKNKDASMEMKFNTAHTSTNKDANFLNESLEIFAASVKKRSKPRHAIIAVVEEENHEDELRIPKELSGHSQLTFTLEEMKALEEIKVLEDMKYPEEIQVYKELKVLEEMENPREKRHVDVFMKLFKCIIRQ
ncbi:uncharacterized protein LOC131952084 [Physella acuta]|uniref:uncharacterized protein LOC131952084 n=1 Tax=Physella acuta TaxID=109671 RepID=UPI0027DD8890|nr:uncharacterized protein LOC131952084 [Physella acuta]XP_059170564.1 uncharacterized protein LOC131952084 [Physella acuta]XP_059170565.1 uncharacterized protein LOC131952084 [Physella acuta]XP_059170566.1 uncharacterized protein LOC131952084 [Physella acuta]XP_059170567.1 uncharacterized protein LOC131952084 [Physella acuta]XP_059170569.1 uncharacterized protein LOC131952084 [Physella acuta]XP_059170570.1 uncharacterized protein LOC131952084 [Physella acuta]XP_059170571.1 uncharacterized p